jgi:phosphoesterase RecJ-like protein
MMTLGSRPAPSQTIVDLFRRTERALILTHYNADGDALGSAVGLALTLEEQGRRAEVYSAGSCSEHLDFLRQGIRRALRLDDLDGYDLLVLLDCHDFDRVGPEAELLRAALAAKLSPVPVIVIDHHLLVAGEEADDTWLHDAAASSTGELVWTILRVLGWRPPVPALQALLMALGSDTGFFSQSNTTAEALRTAADLVELGGDLETIHRRIKSDWPLRRMRLMGLVLDSLEIHLDGRLATMLVTPAMLAAVGATMADTEDFVDLGRGLANVTLAAIVKDSGGGPGTVRVGLRSRGNVNAQGLARLFGGGGHRQAAAYNDARALNADEARANLLARAIEFL